MTTQATYRLYNQSELKLLCDILCENIEDLLKALNISEYKTFDKMITMSCPIHGGDNSTALNLYHIGEDYKGNWKCRTHHCEEVFKSSILGFLRGCLSRKIHNWNNKGDKTISFNESIKFATQFLNKDISNITINQNDINKNIFVNNTKVIKPNKENIGPKIKRDVIQRGLSIPSKYFLERNFSHDVLVKYDIGDCTNPSKEMYNRAVAPIYDMNHEYMIGCSGRSLFSQCSECLHYHDDSDNCPDKEYRHRYKKWKHNYGFQADDSLYNIWYAKDHIMKTGVVVLVESPGNVWRLEECGIHNSVGLFGSSLSDKQKMIIDISGAMTIVTIMDNDEAGKKAQKQIESKCHRAYNIKHIDIEYPDVAEMGRDDIINNILPAVTKYYI